MKKALIILAVIIVHCTLLIDNCVCQWFSQPLPVSGQVQDLKFFDANTGLIAFFNPNSIIRTTNGGYNWNSVLITPVAWEFDIIDSNIVYAVGESYSNDGAIIRSYNRGATWDSLPVSNSVTDGMVAQLPISKITP